MKAAVPTTNDLDERLRACLKVELLCAEIYHALGTAFPGSLFPEAKDLFERLRQSEEEHANIIGISIGISRGDEMPAAIAPPGLTHIRETLGIAEDIKRRIGAERISLRLILTKILELEESLGEIYLRDMMTGQTELGRFSYLRQLYSDERSHAEMVRELMLRKGIPC